MGKTEIHGFLGQNKSPENSLNREALLENWEGVSVMSERGRHLSTPVSARRAEGHRQTPLQVYSLFGKDAAHRQSNFVASLLSLSHMQTHQNSVSTEVTSNENFWRMQYTDINNSNTNQNIPFHKSSR